MNNNNYHNTFIETAENCPARSAAVPMKKWCKKSVPALQYELISKHPYAYTQEDIQFGVYAIRNKIAWHELKKERENFFLKDQPGLQSSSLGWKYGWGIHFDRNGKIALYARESKEYKILADDKTIKHIKAMRSKRL